MDVEGRLPEYHIIALACGKSEKSREPWVKISGLRTKKWTRDIRNTRQKC